MAIFELVVALLFVGGLLAWGANRFGLPYPALLALVGALLALVPGTPSVTLDPDLALALFVAPTLLDAAYDASPRDLRWNIVPVASLAIGMVVATVAAVASTARLLVPDLGWAAAITLGAIVAPPDASAAAAVLRRVQPPHRLLVILQGESLFNDATSLLVYRVAVGAAITGAWSGWSVLPAALLACGGGVLVGYVLARVQIWLSTRVDDVPINVLLQFVTTFAVWMIADRLGLSAIITMVAFAMTLARRLAGRVSARHQIASYTVWEVAVLVLNVLAFVLIGLQLRAILPRIQPQDWQLYALCAGATVFVTIAVRVAWVMTHTAIDRWSIRRSPRRDSDQSPPTYGAAMVSSWCGMRGVVTIATALALPEGAHSFPHRDLVVVCAFAVVLTTLVLQGLTLAPLLRWLKLTDEGPVEDEIRLARAETSRAALRFLKKEGDDSVSAKILIAEYRARLAAADVEPTDGEGKDLDTTVVELQRRAVLVQRDVLTRLRDDHRVGDDAFHVVERELALLELTADTRVRPPVEDGSVDDAAV